MEAPMMELAQRTAIALIEAIATDEWVSIAADVADVLDQEAEGREWSVAEALRETRANIRLASAGSRGRLTTRALDRWAEYFRRALEEGVISPEQMRGLEAMLDKTIPNTGERGARPYRSGRVYRGGPPGTSFGDEDDSQLRSPAVGQNEDKPPEAPISNDNN